MDMRLLQSTPPIVRDFLTYAQVVKGRSAATISEYYMDLRTYFRFLKLYWSLVPADADFHEINISDVDLVFLRRVTLSDTHAFLVYCADQLGNSAKTRARKASAIRSFFKYLTSRAGLLEYNPVEELDTPRPRKSLPKHMTLEESIELLDTVDGPNARRDYCMLTLFLNCGLRLAELCALNVADIRPDRSMRVIGKGNKERIVYLNDACVSALDDYLAVRPHESLRDANALFVSRNRRRISRPTVQKIVYANLEKSGLGGLGLSVHKLRHTAATLMYQHGHVDIRVLKDILGHENLGTTEIYTHLSNGQMQRAMDANPLAAVRERKRAKKETDD